MRFVGDRLGEGRAKKNFMTSHDKIDWRQKRPTTRYEDENGPPPGGCVAESLAKQPLFVHVLRRLT